MINLEPSITFLRDLDAQFWRTYKFPEADNRSKGLAMIRDHLEDYAILLKAVKTAREMSAKGRSDLDCLKVIFQAVGDKV